MGTAENMRRPTMWESLRTSLLHRIRSTGTNREEHPTGDDIFGYFKKAYCIHMPERTDRKRHVSGQFNRIGLHNIEFVHAIQPDDEGVFKRKGTHGCALSHRHLFHQAKQQKLENILIFEDDVVFCEGFLEKIGSILGELRTCDWDIFYFFKPRKGGHDLDGNRGDIISSHRSGLVKTTGSIMTHAYAIHSRCLDLLIEKTDPQYMRDHIPFEIRAIDKAIAHLNLSCYACSTDLTYQNPDLYSSIKVAL